MTTAIEIITATLQEAEGRLDHTFDRNAEVRDELISKLRDVAANVAIDPNAKPSEIEAKLGIINTLGNLLNDSDSQATKLVAVKLKKKEGDDNAARHSEMVAAILAKCSTRVEFNNGHGEVIDMEEASRKLEDKFAECDGEVIIDTELRTDPNDLG